MVKIGSIKNIKRQEMFPLKKKTHNMNTRNIEKYELQHANTDIFKTRMERISISTAQPQLVFDINKDICQKKKTM